MKPLPQLPELPALELDGFTIELDYYLSREYSDIGIAALELPRLIETLNWQSQANKENLMRKEAQLGRTKAEVYFHLKNGGFRQAGYGDKPTEEALKMAVLLDPSIQQLLEDIAIHTAWDERMRNLMRTFQFKLELVRSTEATRRKLPEEPR
jgi:hypothetical protein